MVKYKLDETASLFTLNDVERIRQRSKRICYSDGMDERLAIVYAINKYLVGIEDGHDWQSFLRESLEEVINNNDSSKTARRVSQGE